MGDRFAQAERQCRELARRYDAGDLDGEQLAQELAALQFQDDEAQWWQITADGKWLRYDGEDWRPAAPPRPTPPPPPREVLVPTGRRPRERATGRGAVRDGGSVSAPGSGTGVGSAGTGVGSVGAAGSVAGADSVTPSGSLTGRVEDTFRAERRKAAMAAAPVEDVDIFADTGVPAEQIPGLLAPEPSPAEFLLRLGSSAAKPRTARPLPVQVRQVAPPRPPRPPAQTPGAARPGVAGDPREVVSPHRIEVGAGGDGEAGGDKKAQKGGGGGEAAQVRPVPERRKAGTASSGAGRSRPEGVGERAGRAGGEERAGREERQEPSVGAIGRCAKCKATLRPGASFCGTCGQRVGESAQTAKRSRAKGGGAAEGAAPAGVACPKCHKETPAGTRFCKNCGHKLR